MEQTILDIQENILKENEKNKILNIENGIDMLIEQQININKKNNTTKNYEQKEKDILRALKLLKAKYDAKQNKYANFDVDNNTYLKINIKDVDINNVKKIYTWTKLSEEDKEILIDKVINIEKDKNKLDGDTCEDLRIKLKENSKNIIYDKHNKIIIGYKNLLYVVGDNGKKKYVFINSKSNIINKLNKQIYKFV